MTELVLDSILNDMRVKECKDREECLTIYNNDSSPCSYNHGYFRNEIRIPVPESMNKPQSKSDGKRPYIAIDLRNLSDPLGHTIGPNMVNDFKCNTDYSILINEKEYTTNRVFFEGCKDKVFVHIYLDHPTMPREILFSQNEHYFSNIVRFRILHKKTFVDKKEGILYKYGIAEKYSE